MKINFAIIAKLILAAMLTGCAAPVCFEPPDGKGGKVCITQNGSKIFRK